MTDPQKSEETVVPESSAASGGPSPVGADRRKITEKPEGLLPKVLRVGALLAVIGAGLAFVSYQRVRGQVTESLMGAGEQMMMLDDADRQDAPRALLVNNQRIRFSSGVAPYAFGTLLDRFESRCQEMDAGLMEQVAEAFAARPDHPGAERAASLEPILREQSENSGFVACVDLGRERADLQTMLARFRRFEETRDLHDLGDLRYVYAERAGSDRTHFVAIWTEGSMRFDELFPETGDAAGEDPADIPRPPGARRVLTAFEEGDSQRATIYHGSDLDEGSLERYYRRELPASGWTVLDASDDPRVQAHQRAAVTRDGRDVRPAVVAQRGDRIVFLALTTDAEGLVQTAILQTGVESPLREPRLELGSPASGGDSPYASSEANGG